MAEMASLDSLVRTFCTFRADGRVYGIELIHLREVSTNVTTTPIPQATPGVRGLVNLRSRIYLVLDLRPLLGLPRVDCTSESRLIIFKATLVEDLALLVDSGGEIVRVSPNQIEACGESSLTRPESGKGTTAPLVVGICKLEKELMMIVDPTSFADVIVKSLV